MLLTGCASLRDLGRRGWAADYDTAEARVKKSGRELLIFYEDTRPGVDDRMEEALSAKEVRAATRDYVRCRLFRPYEPDRRYVAQYGVERAPALILVHSDGTYHAHAGTMSAAQISKFLADSKAPGAEPVINPHIPRRVEYDWHGSLESAQAAARQSSQPMLIVYYRRLTRDWARISKLLDTREVHLRFDDMVHCRVPLYRPWTKTQDTEFGTVRVPALVIVESDGNHRTLEMPTSVEAIVRFADQR